MATFLMALTIVGVLIVIGLFVNVYLYSRGALRRRRARRAQFQEKRITTAALDEQYYTSIGIGPNQTPTE